MIPETHPTRRPTLVEETSRALAEHIFSECLPRAEDHSADVWLPSERELAQRFGVSRPVIREATKRLELQGMLEIRHGKGLKVVHHFHKPFTRALEYQVPDTMERLQQLVATRLVIEPEAARLASLQATPDELRELRSIHDKLARTDDMQQAAVADVEFHLRIAQLSGNQIFLLILQSFAELGEESRARSMAKSGINVAREHHASILQAIEKGDGLKAAQKMRFHIEQAGEDLR